MDSRRQRALRQFIATDRLLGVEAVPLGALATTAPPASAVPAAAPAVPRPAAPASPPAPPAPSGASLVAPPRRATGPSLDRAARLRILADIDTNEVKSCTKCELSRGRTHTVFGEGDPQAQLMFIGEGPGETEDREGRPFCGRAGELLDKMIVAMGLKRTEVYIANTVKCRPPNNRTPTPAEIEACWGYLIRQIATLQPRVVVTLGAPASKTLLNTTTGITALRGSWQWFTALQPEGPAIPVMPTFHPAYLLRAYTPDNRRKVWDDLQKVMGYLKGELTIN